MKDFRQEASEYKQTKQERSAAGVRKAYGKVKHTEMMKDRAEKRRQQLQQRVGGQ